MEHLGRRMRVGLLECVWGFSARLSYSHTGGVIKGRCISHGRLWISRVGCLLDWTRHRYVDGDIYLAWLCLLERSGRRDIRVRNDDNVNVRGLNHGLAICWHTDDTDSQPLAVCYDCLCLISLIQMSLSYMMSLSYDPQLGN